MIHLKKGYIRHNEFVEFMKWDSYIVIFNFGSIKNDINKWINKRNKDGNVIYCSRYHYSICDQEINSNGKIYKGAFYRSDMAFKDEVVLKEFEDAMNAKFAKKTILVMKQNLELLAELRKKRIPFEIVHNSRDTSNYSYYILFNNAEQAMTYKLKYS